MLLAQNLRLKKPLTLQKFLLRVLCTPYAFLLFFMLFVVILTSSEHSDYALIWYIHTNMIYIGQNTPGTYLILEVGIR